MVLARACRGQAVGIAPAAPNLLPRPAFPSHVGAEKIVRHWLVRLSRMQKEEGTEKHSFYRCPCWREVRNLIPEKLSEWEQKDKTSKKDWRWQRGITSHSVSEVWKRSLLTVRRWESEKHKSSGIPVEGFGNHVAADGSLLGVSGMWSACGWSVAARS